MEGLFILLLLVAIFCLVIGMVYPSGFHTLFATFDIDSTRKNNAILWISIIVISILVIGGSSDSNSQTALEKENEELRQQLTDAESRIDTKETENEEEIQEVVKGEEFTPSPATSQDEKDEEEKEENNTSEKEEVFRVENVIDGDTIKLENGDVVRYIGIDTPETKHPSKPQECFGQEASKKNEELVEGKEVRLVKDVSETDRYNRLLRYVYVEDVFVNDYLVREGFANASSYPPDVKYQDQFTEAEQKARENERGLWADDACEVEEELKPASEPEPASISKSNSESSYICDCSKTCSQMSSCAEAQYQLNSCGCSRRDGDKDGVACDGDCQ